MRAAAKRCGASTATLAAPPTGWPATVAVSEVSFATPPPSLRSAATFRTARSPAVKPSIRNLLVPVHAAGSVSRSDGAARSSVRSAFPPRTAPGAKRSQIKSSGRAFAVSLAVASPASA